LPVSGDGYWKTIAYGNNTFVAFSYSTTTAASSTDGITWTLRTLPTTGNWSSTVFGNGIFFANGGWPSVGASSTDGITWTERTLPSVEDWRSVTFGDPTLPYVSPEINNIYKDATIQANASEILEPGIVLGAQNSIVVKGTANTTFSVYGVELT
jgi:hypothetical protein